MINAKNREYFKLFRVPAFGNLELLKASYQTHIFPLSHSKLFAAHVALRP